MIKAIKCGLLIILFSSTTYADVLLPRLISDGVILQRDINNLLWGWADNGEKITVKLNGSIIGKTKTKDKKWSLNLRPQKVSGPHKIEIIGKNTVVVNDVYFGDVWIASGQSNMQTTMQRVSVKYPDEIAEANYPKIRHFVVPREYNYNQAQTDLSAGQWQPVTPSTIKDFSAVAHFFSKNIQQTYNVPIGIINSSFGGSPAEAWMSEEALKQFPHFLEVINKYRQGTYLADLIASDKKRNDDWYHQSTINDLGSNGDIPWFNEEYNFSDWQTIAVPTFWEDENVNFKNGVMWFKKEITLTEAEANLPANLNLGTIVDADTAYINGVKVGITYYQYPPRRYTVPENILKAGKNVITVRVISNIGKGGFVKQKPYFLKVGNRNIDLAGTWQYKIGVELPALKGPAFSKYSQPLGFYNAMLSPLLKTKIKGVIWYQGESNTGRSKEYVDLFPAMIRDWRQQFKQGDFPFIYVQLANFMAAKSSPSESGWAETREAQRLALKEPNTAMAVAIDVGEWNDIHPLDKKTVGDRLALAAKKIAYNDKNIIASGPQFKKMKLEGNIAVLSFELHGSSLKSRGESLEGFSIAGTDNKFIWAKAKIVGKRILVWNDKIQTPLTVRYAWADNPDKANLINTENLPASPFQAIVKP